jgi:hypothetical protein
MATEPLYGDPANKAQVWSKYAVLLGGLTATIPATNVAFTLNDPVVPTTGQWDPIGALDTDAPFDAGSETITATDHSAAGLGVYAVSYRDQKEIVNFTAKETRLVTLGIIYDASGVTNTAGNLAGTLKLRDPSKTYRAAFQRENATLMERRITKNYAYIESITRNTQNDESTFTVALAIVPTSLSEIYTYYLGAK